MRERVRIDKVLPSKKVKSVPLADDESGEKFDTVFYINDKWRLAWDGIQYHVQSKHTRETGARAGTSYWRNIAYVCHFGDALLWLARRRIYSVPGTYAGTESLQVLNDRLDAIENEIRSTMKDFMRKRFNQKTHELETT